jgi:hypothetical protein
VHLPDQSKTVSGIGSVNGHTLVQRFPASRLNHFLGNRGVAHTLPPRPPRREAVELRDRPRRRAAPRLPHRPGTVPPLHRQREQRDGVARRGRPARHAPLLLHPIAPPNGPRTGGRPRELALHAGRGNDGPPSVDRPDRADRCGEKASSARATARRVSGGLPATVRLNSHAHRHACVRRDTALPSDRRAAARGKHIYSKTHRQFPSRSAPNTTSATRTRSTGSTSAYVRRLPMSNSDCHRLLL